MALLSKPAHYTDLKIPVFNFHEALKGNLDFLWVDKKGKKDLSEVWKTIYNQYCEAAKVDNRHLKRLARIKEMEQKYITIHGLLQILYKGCDENIIAAARILNSKKYNYNVDLLKPLKPQVERIERSHRVLLTKIEIEADKLPKIQKEQAVSIMRQVIALENLFPGRSIDIYTMPMEKWLALIETADEKARAMEAQLNKRKKK